MNSLQATPFINLLPQSIATDATIQAAAQTLDAVLLGTVRAIPNMLLIARLQGQGAENLLPPLGRISQAAGGLKALPLAELEQLAWQMHVDFREVAKTEAELAAMVRQSIPWHRIKGTPASIHAALALFGIAASIEEDGKGKHWAEYQLNVHGIDRVEQALLAYRVAQEMQPVRCRLGRIYNDQLDTRFIIWTKRSTWSCFYWSAVSGVRDAETGVIISLGKRGASISQPLAIAAFPSHSACRGLFLPYVRAWLWGWSRWSEKYPPASGFVHGQLGSYSMARAEKAWLFRRRSVAREQLVWSGASPAAGRWGDINCRWSKGSFIVVDKPPRWGSFFWGARCGRRELTTLERWIASHGIVLPAPQAANIAPAGGYNACRLCSLYPNNIWRGGWDKRRWNPTPPVPHNSTQAIQGE